jgi:hypothetical protein
MAQPCNPSYLGGGDQEDGGFKASLSKMLAMPPFNQWLEIVVHICYPSFSGQHK